MSAPGIPGEALRALVAAARAAGATVVETPGALVIVAPIAVAASDLDALLPLAEAARVAATSMRTLRDAVRREELPAFGRQRDRAVRRRDLDAWIESRRSRVVEVAADQGRRVELRLAARGAGR